MDLTQVTALIVRQRHELIELAGFETRNKYEILTSAGRPFAFAAEQSKGFAGMVLRYFFGHWRSFEIHFFSPSRQEILVAKHPFRFFFQRLEVFDPQRKFIGMIRQRFGILYKKFDVEDEHGRLIMKMESPLWRLWTFPFLRRGVQVGSVQKRWSGALSEIFTDRDNFAIEFTPQLTQAERQLIMASAILIDLQYFEKKAR